MQALKFRRIFVLIGCLTILFGCKQKNETLFKLLPPDRTGIEFANSIEETADFNILTYEYIYNGGGVGIGDFNNDSLPDIFFTGNQVPNRLYLNQGKFNFEDVSDVSGISVKERWNTGVAVVDINNDGWMDVYVCATKMENPEDRKNSLFVNQGLNSNGVPVFKEMAKDYGIDFDGHSMMAAFFDYDRDRDLDLYILVNVKLNNVPTNFREKLVDGSSANNDRLYRNEGNGTYKDVSSEAGIVYEGFGLGLSITDFNNDGWEDIYVSNDYLSNDILYLNQKNGTFKNETSKFFSHQSQFSMGNDAADINNDGRPDLITLDMLPENSERKKTTIGNKSYQTYINNEKFNYQYQYVRNMLQVNNGSEEGIKFSEVGHLAGVYQTEWSWSPLFADFDNDGFKDLAITNGFPKDITDKDFANYRAELMNIAPPGYLIDSIPVVKIPNYIFKNKGDLTFEDVSAKWGLNNASFSNGAAFADLDRDGDLDYVVNNINSPAFVYENNLIDRSNKKDRTSNFLRVQLKGSSQNIMGLGSKLTVYYDGGKKQFHDHSIYRGYLSSVENIVHFGLDSMAKVDSLLIVWPDSKYQLIKNIKTNQVLLVDYSKAMAGRREVNPGKSTLFKEIASDVNLLFKHSQNDIVDFDFQRTIPHKFSEFGPSLTVGDVNGDGLEDVYIGASPGYDGKFFLQQNNGTFKASELQLQSRIERSIEDVGAALFDFDNDGDLDLYLVKGGFDLEKNHQKYSDLLYINDGKGFFTLSEGLLPQLTASGACVRAADFDGDGDLDLFVGGRVVPYQYPYAPESIILKNESGKFVDVTDQVCPALRTMGMVTDALWSDFDSDGKIDLIVAGELMSIKFLRNAGTSLNTIATEIDNYKGWWNSIAASDFDSDGDIDYVVGNLGLNNAYKVGFEQPVKVFGKDLDENGSVEALTFCYTATSDGTVKLCPVHFWDELNQQSPRFRRQFSRYKEFSKATMETLLSKKDLEGGLLLEANYSSTSYIENLGAGKFKISALPVSAQVATVNGITPIDVNEDGNMDIMMIGNNFGNEVFAGRYDAFTGLVLLGDGKGKFTPIPSAKSGFYVPNDAKSLVKIFVNDQELVLASQNRDSLKVFANRNNQAEKIFTPETYDVSALLHYANGKKQKIEFYYGSGYLSQSTRKVFIPKGVEAIEIFNSKGESRKQSYPK